ncbi:MAG: hypothetical protein ABI851_12775 [Saprospiraceae bacterium]
MNTINNYFNTNRFGYLLKREVRLTYKAFGLVTAITLLFYALGNIIAQFTAGPNVNTFNSNNLLVSLTFMLLIWANISFNELATTPGRQHYLSIPASALEKLGSKWMLLSLLLPVCFILIFICFSFLATWSVNIFGSKQIPLPTYDMKEIFQGVLMQIGLQAVFYLGSITWPKYSLFKTLFFVFLSFIALSLISYFFAAIIFHDHLKGGSLSFNEHNFSFDGHSFDNIPMLSKLLGVISFLSLMVISYFKLQEKEL